jgi:hypothetical protein
MLSKKSCTRLTYKGKEGVTKTIAIRKEIDLNTTGVKGKKEDV